MREKLGALLVVATAAVALVAAAPALGATYCVHHTKQKTASFTVL